MLLSMQQTRKKFKEIPAPLREEIIKLAWADTVPFENIYLEYKLTENEVQTLMRTYQTPKTYTRWRKRVTDSNQASSKHKKLTHKTSTKTKN